MTQSKHIDERIYFLKKLSRNRWEFIRTSKHNYCALAVQYLIVECPLCNELMFGKPDKSNYNNVTRLAGMVFSFGHSVQFCYYLYRITCTAGQRWRINHFWDAFRFGKEERKWKMTGCLLLGLSDEKVTKVPETPTGPKEKRIPTSFIDDTRIMLTLRFFFIFQIFTVLRCAGSVWGILRVGKGFSKVTVIFRTQDVFFLLLF